MLQQVCISGGYSRSSGCLYGALDWRRRRVWGVRREGLASVVHVAEGTASGPIGADVAWLRRAAVIREGRRL